MYVACVVRELYPGRSHLAVQHVKLSHVSTHVRGECVAVVQGGYATDMCRRVLVLLHEPAQSGTRTVLGQVLAILILEGPAGDSLRRGPLCCDDP
jgi:hypothetical protein